MSRGLVPGLATAAPFGPTLPSLYQEDDFAMRFVSAFDESLAPILSTIDNFPAYLDPALTPPDFLDWLAGWVGILLDETWPIERRRAFVAVAAQLYRQRGTAGGLAAQVRLFTAGEVDIIESGGSAWSPTADAAPPGSPDFKVTVRVTPPPKVKIDAAKLDALVNAAKPAHVVHRIEIVTKSSATGGASTAAPTAAVPPPRAASAGAGEGKGKADAADKGDAGTKGKS